MPFQKGHKINLGRKRPDMFGNEINLGRKRTKEQKEKYRLARLGKHHSEETKRKIGNSHKGEKCYNFGKHLSDEIKKKLSKALKGKKSYLWKGGISKKFGYAGFIQKRREIRKRGNGGYHTLGEWEILKAQYNWICPCCKKKETKIVLTEDHIIPLSRGGSDNIENIQPLCKSCNCKKHTKIIKYTVDITGI